MTRKRRADDRSLEEARELLRLVDESSIVELEAVWDGGRVSVRREEPPADGDGHGSTGRASAEGTPGPLAEPRLFVASAPTVGRFWRGSGAGAEAFVEKGQRVQLGQQLATVESLAAPVEVLAEHAGEVQDILAEDGQAVGYGDPLFAVRADDA